ncbi:MAG: hypothetical protein FWH17_10185 [Oscillospiraceae bacterium]|nr:hypothetical protein [Oscillospiraceae bacterium]
MKIALGMIVRHLDTETKLTSFIDNADKYGHTLHPVIVGHTRVHDAAIERKIREKATFYAININNPDYCISQMKKLGLSESAILTLTKCPVDTTTAGLVPYGHNRMIVVMEAILREADVLVFADSDVIPSVLKLTPEGAKIEEVDFFGAHLRHLREGADVTTSDYSGYNILPPASFDGMDDFLIGVQKEEMIDYWQNSSSHRSIVYQPDDTQPRSCKKILGGNLAIRLSALAKLPPFFSSHYTMDGELFLCRGEDTVLGSEFAALGTSCTDIGVYPLHDTYDHYPAEPNLQKDEKVQNRFYYACAGWVGRNPFFNYILGNDLNKTRQYQREHLKRGLSALSEYTSNPRFNKILQCFDVSWNSADRYISEFNKVNEAWESFKAKLKM